MTVAVRCSGATRAGARCKRETTAEPPGATWFCRQHLGQAVEGVDYPGKVAPSLGGLVADWIEEFLVHGPGPVQGDPIDFAVDGEFERFVWDAYELEPGGPAGWRFAHSQAHLSRPKGRYKSGLLAMIGGCELCEGFRFDGFDAGRNPVGAPKRYREVLSVATEEGQAGLTYDVGRFMLKEGDAADAYPLDIGLTRTNVLDGSESVWEPITSGAASKDGGKTSCLLEDEGHLYVTRELRQLHNTLTRNITKQSDESGLIVSASTMYLPGEMSVAESIFRAAEINPDGRIHIDHRQAPMTVDIDDDDQLRAGLQFAYGDSAPWQPIDLIIVNEFHQIGVDPLKTEADGRRYWLNQPWKGENRAFDVVLWTARADRSRTPATDSVPVVLLFDGAETRDCAVLTAWTVEDRPHHFLVDSWVRPFRAERDYRHPVGSIRLAVSEAFETLDVAALIYDQSYRGLRSLYEEWEATWGEWKAGGRVIGYKTREGARMGPAIERFAEDMRRPGTFTHDDDQLVNQHIANAVLIQNRQGLALAKERDSMKIDAAVCAVFGYDSIAAVRARIADEAPTVLEGPLGV